MNNNILINGNILQSAQVLFADITNKEVRNKLVANLFAVKIAQQAFEDEEFVTDSETGICNVATLAKDIDIADFYIEGAYIDVRICSSDSGLCIPKVHYDKNILPLAYMFVSVNTDLSQGEVLGFVLSKDVDVSSPRGDYFVVDETNLVSFYDVKNYLIPVEDSYSLAEEDIYSYIDGTFSDNESFYKELIASKSARVILSKVYNSYDAFKDVSLQELDAVAIESVPEEVQTMDTEDSLEELLNENVDDSYINELNDVAEGQVEEFSTEITPSFNVSNSEINEISNEIVETAEEESEQASNQGYTVNVDSELESTNGDYIGELFNDNVNQDKQNDKYIKQNKKSSSKFLLILGFFAVLAAAGYFYYNNTLNQAPQDSDSRTDIVSEDVSEKEVQPDAMPLETVDAPQKIKNNDEGTSVSIPAIEQNLDASVLVSNLKVEWEVPTSYASSTPARRYLVKLGKVIQLRLKTELLLLSKPPITNKIALEIKYNSSDKKFETVSIVTSSGEQLVDNVIKNTVDSVLNMKLSTNVEGFSKLQGNPVLIIKL